MIQTDMTWFLYYGFQMVIRADSHCPQVYNLLISFDKGMVYRHPTLPHSYHSFYEQDIVDMMMMV